MAITALAGPVSNLLAALVGAVILVTVSVFLPYNWIVSFLVSFLSYYVIINISLAVFNLIPMPPLDGSRILGAFLSDRALRTYYRYQNVFVMLMFVLLLTGALSGPLGIVQNFFYRIIITIAKLPFQLFGAI